jgi:hypothetical protein
MGGLQGLPNPLVIYLYLEPFNATADSMPEWTFISMCCATGTEASVFRGMGSAAGFNKLYR